MCEQTHIDGGEGKGGGWVGYIEGVIKGPKSYAQVSYDIVKMYH